MPLPKSFLKMLSDPAPGLVFGPHKHAKVGERAYATPHEMAPPASAHDLKALRQITRGNPALADVEEFYSRWNGGRLCILPDALNNRDVGALEFLPISQWDATTQPFIDGDMAWSMEGCDLYTHGNWKIIALLPSEGLSLVLFLDGEYEGRQLAGEMYAIALDPMLGYEELLAPNFSAFLGEFARDPAEFFKRVGFVWTVDSEGGQSYGDPISAYIPDVRNHPSLRDW